MTVDYALLEELRQYSTPTILNGLKKLGQPTQNLESMDRSVIRCMSPALGVSTGFAVTRKVITRTGPKPPSSGLPPAGLDEGILAVPAPRFLVVENAGDWQGRVCIWGELAANLNIALGCVAGVTNGPVRDLPEMEAAGFQTFGNGLGTGGGTIETVEIGGTVVIGGVTVNPGDIIHGDAHGVIRIPAALAADLPDAIAKVQALERRVVAACRLPGPDMAAIEEAWNAMKQGQAK